MALAGTIANELRLLRRLPGPLDDAKLVHAPHILKGLGGGDTAIALNRLLLIRNRHQTDRDVVAALATIGYGADGDTVLDRLSAYGVDRYVDARTVRRWSDAGIAKLAALILTDAPWFDPQIELKLDADEQRVVLAVRFQVPSALGMRLPTLEVEATAITMALTKVAADDDGTRYTAEPVTVDYHRDRVEAFLRWRGEIVPIYVLESSSTPKVAVRSSLSLYALNVLVTRREASLDRL